MRLRAAYEDAKAWAERGHATPGLQRVADDQRDDALAAWWLWTEELAPLVVSYLNRRLRRAVSVLCTTMPTARDW